MKLLRKHIIITIVILLVAMTLSGCNDQPKFHGNKTADGDSFYLDFEILNTTFTHELAMEAGEQIDVVYDLKGQSILGLSIQKGDEQPIYRGEVVDSGSFSVGIEDAGVYTLTVTGYSAIGYVRFQRHRQLPAGEMDILQLNGELLGRIDNRARATVIDEGIFYSVFTLGPDQFTATAQYRFFRISDQKDIVLGELEDQSYEALFFRQELNGVIYTLATTGSLNGTRLVKLYLLAFDPQKETMKSYLVSSLGLTFAALTVANDKLLIRNYEFSDNGGDKIYEFDPTTESLREVLCFKEDAVSSLRSIYFDNDTLYLLHWHQGQDGGPELWLDRYDSQYDKISEQPLTDMILNGLDVNNFINEEDKRNELNNNVSGFRVIDDRWLFYENYAVVRMLLDLEKKEAVFVENDLYSLSLGNGAPAFYRMMFAGEEEMKPQILSLRGDQLLEWSFQPVDGRCLLKTVSHSPNGSWLYDLEDSAGSRALYYVPGS